MTETQHADLSALRINRSEAQEPSSPGSGFVSKIIYGLVFIALAALAYWGYSRVVDPAIEVQLTTVALSSPSQANAVLNASGYVVAQRKAAVASKATGRLEYLGVAEGDRVTKGQIIARVEDGDMKAALDQARANLKINEADLKDAERWLSRQKALLEKQLTTQAEYDGAEARQQRVIASIGVAKAIIASAEVALENTRIRAPFDGTVLTKNADVGEVVAPLAASVSSRSAVVTIADMKSLKVEADVSESNIERIVLNQPCEITLDAYPEIRYQGYVSKIVPTADRAKATVQVKVGFKSYDSKVLPEMSAKVLFLTKAGDAAVSNVKPILTVSSAAVVTRNGKKMAFMIKENTAVEVPVTTGNEMGSLVEIKQGLSVGDKVINKVDARITNGAKVRVQ